VRCWWPTRTTFISNTCSTWFKPFHPFINLLLTHGALSILSQHTMMNFHRFHSSAQRNRTMPRSSMVQSCKWASRFLPSLLPFDWRQSAVLHMAEIFNRHYQYCAMQQFFSVPVTAQFKNCLYFLIHPHTLHNCVLACSMHRSQHQGIFWVWYVYFRCMGKPLNDSLNFHFVSLVFVSLNSSAFWYYKTIPLG